MYIQWAGSRRNSISAPPVTLYKGCFIFMYIQVAGSRRNFISAPPVTLYKGCYILCIFRLQALEGTISAPPAAQYNPAGNDIEPQT